MSIFPCRSWHIIPPVLWVVSNTTEIVNEQVTINGLVRCVGIACQPAAVKKAAKIATKTMG
jgi:hypothetical protein